MSDSEAPPAKKEGSEPPAADQGSTPPPAAGSTPPPAAGSTPPPAGASGAPARRQRPILYSDASRPPAAPPPSERAPKSKKVIKGAKRWLPIVIIGLLLVGGGLAAVYFLLVRPAGGPELTSKVPRDVDIYIEVPSVKRLVKGLSTMRFFDEKKLDMDRWIDQAEDEVAASLDLSDDEAKDILEGVQSVGLAARVGEDSYEGALILRFESSKAARVLLSSERFFEADDDGVGGKRYLIDRDDDEDEEDGAEEQPYDPTLSPSSLRRSLFGFKLRGDEKVAWFKQERLVVIGHEILLDDVASVLKGKQSSLDDNKRFQQARKLLPRSVAAFGYVDTQMFEVIANYRERDQLDYFLKEPEPIIGSLSFDDAGSRFSVAGGLSGKMMPPDKAYTEPVDLTLAKRLPKEVIAYFALSTKMDVEGVELEQMVLDGVRDAEPDLAKEIRREIANAEKELGFRLTSVYDALGDEGIVAVMPHKSYKLDFNTEPSLAQDYAVAYIQHTDDLEGAERIVERVRDSIFPDDDEHGGPKVPFRVRSEDNGGFTAEPDDPAKDPFVMVRFSGSYMMAAVGRRDVCERFWSAFTDGKDTLGDDEAHDDAIDALPSGSQGYAWVDTGRIFAEALDANPGLEKDAQQFGFEPSAVTTTGDGRVTSALSFGWSVEDDVWHVKLHTLNTTWMVPIAAYVEYMQTQMRMRTYQARNTVKAIASAANAAYRANRYDWRNYTDTSPNAIERLCQTATPVPAAIPKRDSYLPEDEAGKDWNAGDDKTGWKCLKFSLSQEMYFQYSYNVGGGYKGPARGGPDPGPNGFEVAAEGDLDGDGKTSLFTMTGIIDPTTGTLTLATTEFAVDELE
jgi:hypothetical protein